MSMIEKVYAKARADVKRIVLPEGEEERTLLAAAKLKAEGLAEPILLGKEETIRREAGRVGADLRGLTLLDPETSEKTEAYADALYELRKAKGLTREAAADLARDPMYYGILMVKLSDADGLVSGAVHTTGDMLRPALQIIKTRPGIHIVSSSFLMNCPNHDLGDDGLLVYADCIVNPCPTAEELAEIAVTSAYTARDL